MNKSILLIQALAACLLLASCETDRESTANLILKIRLDSTQQRLNNLGQVATLPAGHAAQSPNMHKISAHYVELASNAFTAVGAGEILYHAPETQTGGATAINFNEAIIKGNNEVFLTLPIKDLSPGTYEYLRVSLSYQNYDINIRYDSIHNINGNNFPVVLDIPTRIASFVGYNNFIQNVQVDAQTIAVNSNKAQGFWAAEGTVNYMGQTFNFLNQGQSPAGATTVVNPLHATSPIPAGSCLATGAFAQPLSITGQEKEDITVIISLSTNRSFEWQDYNANGLWDANKGEPVVDMGLRGLIPIIE
jgi:hypothetical protein